MYGRRLHHKTARDADRRQTVLYHVCISGRTFRNAVLVTTPWDQLTGEQLMEAMEQKTSIAMELEELEKEAHSA